ncbi:hypothetical protein IFR05_007393 [Cadophora sp. M221]|nr:hypothetical protein IFR05_007393 [Cadophora sp. M221]
MVAPPRRHRPSTLVRAAVASGTSLLKDVVDFTPHLEFFRDFFATWLKLDSSTLAASLTIFTALTDTVERQSPRVLAAKTVSLGNNTFKYSSKKKDAHEKRPPIKFLPTFETMWFVHDRNIFLVHRILEKEVVSGVAHEYAEPPSGDEPLVTMVLGRTNSISRPMRSLETVHFDEATKADLVGIVLLEDIDAVGMQRKSAIDEMEEEQRQKRADGKEKDKKKKFDDEEEKKHPSRQKSLFLAFSISLTALLPKKAGSLS